MTKSVTITAANLVDQLRAAFPEIENRFQEELRLSNGEFPGNYNVFAFVFKPYLRAELVRENNQDFLVRFCDFMELICTSQDIEAINVLWLKIFKLLLADSSMVKKLWPFLGNETKVNLADAASRWGMINSVPVTGLLSGLKHWIEN